MTKKTTPKVIASGYLTIFDNLPCYNLDNGQRVFRFRNMTQALTGKDHGKFANYLATENIREHLPERLRPEPTRERTPQGVTEAQLDDSHIIPTYDATDFIDVCIAFISAAETPGVKLSVVQQEIVERARRFIIASAKLGITGLIDEATGYQYVRPGNELEMKMALFLVEERRPWEKTFPDQFWVELARLTNWPDPKRRPKYWGKLVNEFVYEALDKDIFDYLKKNMPPKYTGQRYHQWLTEDRGVKALVEHLWTLIGLAKTCETLEEWRYEKNRHFSKNVFQPMMFPRKDLGPQSKGLKHEPEKEAFDKLLDAAIKPE